MRTTPQARRSLAGWLVDVVAVLACAGWAARVSAGMDVSWDLIAYHHYYSWLFMNGGLHQADPEPYVNRYVNPLAQLPWYLIDRTLSPRAATAAIAAVAALNLALVRRITLLVLPRRLSPWNAWLAAVGATALAATGAVFSMELGMSVADVVVSLPMLAAVLALLGWMRPGQAGRRAVLLLVVAGALTGVAVGVKLTMANYAIALGLCVAYAAWCRRSVRPVAWFGGGGLLGLLASAGWWYADIWKLTGNPIFPFYNSVFGSPLWGQENVRDERFGARGLLDALQYPWYMATGTPRVLDVPMRDVRWLVLCGLVVLGLVALAVTARRRPAAEERDRVAVFWTFLVVGGVLWVFQFGIARYAVTTELLTGPALTLCLVAVLRRGWLAAVAAGALALGMAPLNQGHFYHVPFQRDRFMVQAAPLRAVPPGSVVLADNGSSPSGYLLEYLPPGTERHILQGWFDDTPLLRTLQEQRLARASHLYVIVGPAWPRQPRARAHLLTEIGLEVDDASCQQIRSTLPTRHLCEARYVGPSG